MNISQTDIIIFIIAFISTVFFTLFVRKILKDANITDKPIVTEHSHKAGTPTMGGLAILLGILLISCIYFTNKNLVLMALLMLTASIIGLFDDLIGLKTKEIQKKIRNISSGPIEMGRLMLKPGEEARVATPKAKKDLIKHLEENNVEIIGEAPIKNEVKESEKIFAQILISLFLVGSGAVSSSVLGFNLGILVIPVIIFGIIGAINAVNLIDGMDGLAAGIVAIASSACAIFSISIGNFDGSVPFIALSGVSFGFLALNRYPASIFMGDTGAFALGAGYITAAFLGNIIYFALIALAIPILSVVVSLMHRAHIIKLPVEPLHHTLNYKGLSEKKIVVLYWGITVLICALALYFYHYFII
ncbi:MAG: glycosyltransferase family 4 protein [Methanobacterium sp.]|uniref:glycosyltransferase family 4 protein n=1 Tax=Methanobacterium sp. TaxID=2164 RepID=UPI003D64B01D|nr:glycosyltransferase family 4 protein [Methanobacterium sp.]